MNSSSIIVLMFVSIVSLIGTLSGASLGILIKHPTNRFLSGIVGFAAGLMLAVVVFDLIPESIEKWNFTGTLIFSVLGIVLIMIVDNMFNKKNIYSNKYVQVAIMTAIGLMLHNFPEGIIMGCGFIVGGNLGIKMCIIIAIHDIPEGIAVSAPMMASKLNPFKIFVYTALTALPTAFGATLGLYVGSISNVILGISLATASGIMLYVICGEMIPESAKLWDGIVSTIGILSGLFLGLIICTVL